MKCKLIKTEKGIISMVDERPKMGDWYYDTNLGKCIYNAIIYDNKYNNHHKIISSTFGVGLELEVFYNTYSKATKQEVLDSMVGFEYSYIIKNGKVILELY